MAYEKQNFTDGEVLFAEHLNKIEEQIVANETAVEQKADIQHIHTEYAENSHNHSASDITSGILPLSNGGTGATKVLDAANNLQVPSLTQGSSLTEGTDLNDVLNVGNYRCTTISLSNSLLNCPCAGWVFTMKVGCLPNNPSYIYQEITVFTNGEHWYRKKVVLARIGLDG